MEIISTWSEKSILYSQYNDVIELVYQNDINIYYLIRHSPLGEIIEKIELKPEIIYKKIN
jgi:hypothetical protein